MIRLRVATKWKLFSTADTNNSEYDSTTITDIIEDTIPCYRIEKIPERDYVALLRVQN